MEEAEGGLLVLCTANGEGNTRVFFEFKNCSDGSQSNPYRKNIHPASDHTGERYQIRTNFRTG